MATPEVLQIENDLLVSSPFFDHPKGEDGKSRGIAIEKKIEFLETLAGKISNRRTRRWVNDRLLMELVPRLNVQEIRGLFAPPPWGEDIPLSPFCMTNVGEWDKFRHIDMDKEVTLIEALKSSSSKRKGSINADKVAVLNAWHRVDCRTREALRRSFLSDIVSRYEECVRAFLKDSVDGEVLAVRAEDSFRRLLLHGICEFYNLVSVTATEAKGTESLKMIRIKKKKAGSVDLPNITLCQFLKMAKQGSW